MKNSECCCCGEHASLRTAVTDAMDMLKNMAAGGIGDDGPTLEELDAHVESTGSSWDDDTDYHTVQWAWRKLQQGLNA